MEDLYTHVEEVYALTAARRVYTSDTRKRLAMRKRLVTFPSLGIGAGDLDSLQIGPHQFDFYQSGDC